MSVPYVGERAYRGSALGCLQSAAGRITTLPAMFPPQTLPHSNVGSRFENGRLCLEANGPNLSGCYLINTTGGGGGSRRGGNSPGLPLGAAAKLAG